MRLIAGSLTRIYAKGDPAARERVAAGVRRWMDDLNEALRPHLRTPLEWNEEQEESRTVDLSAAAHRALLLLAAYAQKTDFPWPDEVPPSVQTDPAFQEISAADFARCHYPQVVIPSFWVPGDFALTMKHALPDGGDVVLGSLEGLQVQLRQLNRNTLQLRRPALIACAPAGPGMEFVAQATCGLSAFLKAAEEAGMLGVPLALT